MAERENVEERIREILATETQAIPLGNKLFSPQGLFNQLAETEQERRRVAQSSLFREAQKRLTELQRTEAEAFAKVVDQAHSAIPPGEYGLKLVGVESP
jgi:hypothetical protein